MTAPPQIGEPGIRIPTGRYGFGHVARMEWIKFRSLRSTLWALLLTSAAMVGIGVVTMANTQPPSLAKAADFDPTNNVLAGMALGQLVIGVLGVLAVAGEYASGSIRSTFAAIPRRPLVLTAKAAVLGVTVLAAAEVATFVTFFAGVAALSDAVPHPSLGEVGVVRALILSGVYLAMVGLIGIGLGAATRHTASATGVLAGIIFVVPAVLAGTTGTTIAKHFPTMIAANSLAVAKPVDDMLSPWAGLGVMSLYTAAVLSIGGWVMSRCDA